MLQTRNFAKAKMRFPKPRIQVQFLVGTPLQINEEPAPTSPYIDKDALARHLGLSRRTIDNWLQRGMPHLKLGARRVRFDLREIEAWLHRECRTVRYGKSR